MATQEELNNQQEYNNSLDNTRENLRDILTEQRNLADEARGFAKALFNSSAQATATSRAFRGVANISKEISSQYEDIISGEKSFEDIAKSIIKLKREEKLLNVELEQALSSAKTSTGELAFDQEQIRSVLSGQLGVLDLVYQSEKEITNEALDLLSLYDAQKNTLKDQNIELEDIEKRSKNIEEGLGSTGRSFSGLDNILQKVGGGKFSEALGLKDALKQGRLLSSELTNGGRIAASSGMKTQVMGKMLSTVGKNISKAFGPLALIAELVQGIVKADKETVELQKSMALTSGESMAFRTNLALAASSTGDINITTTKLLKSFSDLNKQFGFITNFSTETLVTMSRLTEVVGIGSESAGNLAAASSLTGKSFESNYKDVLGTSYELQRQSGVQMDLRNILEQTGKITGTVRANLGANPSAIAAAVTQAKLFGASLQDVANASKSLLEFESSIQSELEAELLLGRDINLERARAAALAGDQVTLAQELQKQAGSFEKFTSLNVIQQEALAKAMGMQSDQLADILFQQAIQGKTAKDLRAAGQEELAQRLEAQTLADKFNNTVEKLKGIFADVGTAFMPVLRILGAALSIVGAIVGLLGDVIKLFKGELTFENSGFINGIKGIGGSLGISSSGGNETGPANYNGNIVKTGNNDTSSNSNSSTNRANLEGGDNMKETNSLLREILTKQGTVKMDSTNVGTAFSMNTYQVQ